MKSRYKLLLLVILMAVVFVVTRFFDNENPTAKEEKNRGIRFTQTANDRGGNYWEYKLSNDKVITEIDYYHSRSFLNFGPAETQNWIFEPVNTGEVTITWQEYEGGGFVGSSYEVTYYFDKDGNYTVLNDTKKR